MNDMRNEYTFCQKLLKKGTTSKIWRRWKYDIKMDHKECGTSVCWIDLFRHKGLGRIFVDT